MTRAIHSLLPLALLSLASWFLLKSSSEPRHSGIYPAAKLSDFPDFNFFVLRSFFFQSSPSTFFIHSFFSFYILYLCLRAFFLLSSLCFLSSFNLPLSHTSFPSSNSETEYPPAIPPQLLSPGDKSSIFLLWWTKTYGSYKWENVVVGHPQLPCDSKIAHVCRFTHRRGNIFFLSHVHCWSVDQVILWRDSAEIKFCSE